MYAFIFIGVIEKVITMATPGTQSNTVSWIESNGNRVWQTSPDKPLPVSIAGDSIVVNVDLSDNTAANPLYVTADPSMPVAVSGTVSTSTDIPTTFVGTTKTVAAVLVPEQLVAVSTPCKFVWIGSLCTADGAATNTKPVFIGDSATQNIPVVPSNIEGITISINDASKIYVKVGFAGEGVNYRIFA